MKFHTLREPKTLFARESKKYFYRGFIGALTLLFYIALLSSCCSLKSQNVPVKKSFILHLKNDLGIDYLEGNYKRYGYQEAARISKSQNKWQVEFLMPENEVAELQEKFKNDSNITLVEIPETEPSPPTNNSNSGQGKTQPIKK